MIVQTPGVYITEKNNLPPSVAGVSTAIPAFIGFTEKQANGGNTLRITSMFEFENAFGSGYLPHFTQNNDPQFPIVPDKRFYLYDSLNLYFRNGGGPCYIISAGLYNIADQNNVTSLLENALNLLGNLDEVTLTLMPDMHFQFNNSGTVGALSGQTEYTSLASALITKCAELQDKFALLDYHQPSTTKEKMRDWVSPTSKSLKYGALYFPWFKNAESFLVGYDQISLTANTGSTHEIALNNVLTDRVAMDGRLGDYRTIEQLKSRFNELAGDVSTKTKLTAVFSFLYQLVVSLDSNLILNDIILNNTRNALSSNGNFTNEVKKLFWFTKTLGAGASGMLSNGFPLASQTPNASWITIALSNYTDYADLISHSSDLGYNPASLNTDIIVDLVSKNYVNIDVVFAGIAGLIDATTVRKNALEQQLFTLDSVYSQVKSQAIEYLKQIPSQGAIAGLYCKNDRERGVWKSPANMAIQGIEKPLIEVSNAQQDGLNVDVVSGKSINVIRTFTGKGALVWGARTLDGNSNEWRYIAVRRFFSFAEESIKKAMGDFVFEPNNARTWVKIKAMVTGFLVEQWKVGALVGTSLDQAFFVNIGDNTTTPTEILNGIINIQIGMAVARPAEFIILEFSHQVKN